MNVCKCGKEIKRGLKFCLECKWEVLERDHDDSWYIKALDKINTMTNKQLRDFVRKR